MVSLEGGGYREKVDRSLWQHCNDSRDSKVR
jgi:hypothetical protein